LRRKFNRRKENERNNDEGKLAITYFKLDRERTRKAVTLTACQFDFLSRII